jgi:sterol desaturase/sphingolipid hydroxylase (fatty acid hydroxylase superfamily)
VASRAGAAANVAVSLAVVALTVRLAAETLVGLVVAAMVAASLEVLHPLHDRRRTRAALLTDLTHAVGNRFLILPAVVLLFRGIGTAITRVVPDAVPAAFGALPWWGQLAVAFPLADLGSYLGHRALHQVPLLWRLHRVHHSSGHLDWLATSRTHPLDLVLNLTAATIPAYALGYVDRQPWLLSALFLYPFVAHANARLPLPGLDRVLVSPAFHHWHHAAVPEAHDRNFGAILSVWDRLFGTAHEPGGWPARYGVGLPALDTATYGGHLVSPLRRYAPDQEGGPKARSPQSPRPGRMKAWSSRRSSMAPTHRRAPGWRRPSSATPSGAAMRLTTRTSRAPRSASRSSAVPAEPPVATMGSSTKAGRSPTASGRRSR